MKWLKLHNDIIHDPKIRALAYEDRWHFVALMVLMNDGTLDEPESIRDELVEVCLGLHGIDLANLKNRLVRLRLIDDGWRPVQWESRQAAKDATGAERQKKFREKQKDRKRNALRNGDVTEPLRTEEEVEEEEKIVAKNAPYLPMAEAMWEAIQPITKSKKANLNSWANDLRLLHEADGRSMEDIKNVFYWANHDQFWRQNILSASKLRAQFPTLYAQRQAKVGTSAQGGWRKALGGA